MGFSLASAASGVARHRALAARYVSVCVALLSASLSAKDRMRDEAE